MDNVEDVYPLAPIQLGMLFHSALAPRSPVYIGQVEFTLQGALDVRAFKAAWDDIVDRHAILRSAFYWNGLDEPLQVVRQRVELPWEIVDLRGLDDAGREIAERAEVQRIAGFPLEQAPLMNMLLTRLGDRTYHLVWTCHHLLLDGWSVTNLMPELAAFYAARIAGQPVDLAPVFPYRRYVDWLRQRDPRLDEPFWRRYLTGIEGTTGFSALSDSPRARKQSSPARFVINEHRLPDGIGMMLERVAREQRITSATLVHGAYAVLVSRYAGSGDVVFGSTVAGRPATLKGIDRAAGLFINTLPVRVTVDAKRKLGDWLQALQENLSAVREHEHSALFRIEGLLGRGHDESLFDHILVVETFPKAAAVPLSDDVEASYPRIVDQSNYPLALLVNPGEEFLIRLVYDPERFDDGFAQTLLQQFVRVLVSIPDHLDAPPTLLPLLDAEETKRQLVMWNDTDVTLPAVDSVIDLIEQQVRQRPGEIAVAYEDRTLNYQELWRRSGELARALVAAGAGGGAPVAVCIERGIELVSALLGVLRAGACYLPLDPVYPREHLKEMLRDSGARLLLTAHDLVDIFTDAVAEILLVNAPAPDDMVDLPVLDSKATAYIIYTSGSSGEPKGVPISHESLLNSTFGRFDYYGESPGAFLLLSSFSFDSSVAGIYWTLAGGGRLVISARRAEQDAAALSAVVAAHGITHTLCLPSLYRALLEYAETSALAGLRAVVVAGESVSPALPAMHRTRLPGVRLFNEYGPTEAAVWCSVADITQAEEGGLIPIGRPVANTRIYLLDRHGCPVPAGVPGEVHIAGKGLSNGYLHRAAENAEKFVAHTLAGRKERLYRTGDLARLGEDSQLQFLGRIDRQVKIRGHRIEPGLIEAELMRLPGLREAVVVAHSRHAQVNLEKRLDVDDTDGLEQILAVLEPELADQLLSDIEGLAEDEAARMLAAHQALAGRGREVVAPA